MLVFLNFIEFFGADDFCELVRFKRGWVALARIVIDGPFGDNLIAIVQTVDAHQIGFVESHEILSLRDFRLDANAAAIGLFHAQIGAQ